MSSFENNENNAAFWYDKIQLYASEEEQEEEDENNKEYNMGLAMWIKYGLTKERYDENLEHRENIAALDAFYADPESYLAPRYGELLEEKIRKYEEDALARELASDCYPDYPSDELDEDWTFFEYEDEEDMAERYRLERLESAIENARDDMLDDC